MGQMEDTEAEPMPQDPYLWLGLEQMNSKLVRNKNVSEGMWCYSIWCTTSLKMIIFLKQLLFIPQKGTGILLTNNMLYFLIHL